MWDFTVCIPVQFSGNNLCQSAAETCRRLCVSTKTLPQWHWDVFHSIHQIIWPVEMASSCGYRLQHAHSPPTTTTSLPHVAEMTVMRAPKKPMRMEKRCVRGEEKRAKTLIPINPSSPPDHSYHHAHANNASSSAAFIWFVKGFRAPTVDQIVSTDPGRITEEPICVR